MKRWGPLGTLLAGLAVGAVLLVMNVRIAATGPVEPTAVGAVATASPPAAPASPPPASTGAPAPTAAAVPSASPSAPAALNVTWAGKVDGGGATIAISAKGDQAVAYLCDGDRIEAWLQGTAADGRLDLNGTDASLTGSFGNGRAEGTVTVDGRTWTFDVAAVQRPGGLYRSTADVRGARIVGGWIVLADGTQVGLATVNGTTTVPSALDLDSGTATVAGATVSAASVDGDL